MRHPLIAGNWKMHGSRGEGEALVADLEARRRAAGTTPFDLAVCPPFTLLETIGRELAQSGIALGAQDCHWEESGAHTGDVAPGMLAEAACRYVIVGHSERRQDHGEPDEQVYAKANAARRHGLVPILCVGETQDQRDAGETKAVLDRQLSRGVPEGLDGGNLVIAYEPVWAIGTGRSATPDDVAEAHGHIRARLSERVAQPDALRILYGGSVKPANAAELLSLGDVDGALVGGASLKADSFWQIAQAAG